MAHGSLASLLSLPFFVLVSLALTHGGSLELKELNTGKELEGETLPLNMGHRVYKADSFNPVYVQVTAKAAGVVAQPYTQEREVILFNIVCDELLLGITYNAWWVGIAVLLCLAFAAVTPCFLRRKQWQQWLKYKSSQSNRRRVKG